MEPKEIFEQHLETIRTELDRAQAWLSEGRLFTAVAKDEQLVEKAEKLKKFIAVNKKNLIRI